jgi:hypothetical protein
LAGASGYYLDVSTNQYFIEGSSVNEAIREDSRGFTVLEGRPIAAARSTAT